MLDLLFLPGMVIAQVLFPGGVHGDHPQLWVMTLYLGSFFFYLLAITILFFWIGKLRKVPKSGASQ